MKISRRKFVTISMTGIPAVALSERISLPVNGKRKLTAAVLEYAESRTNYAVGAEKMLREAGFEVIPLMPEPDDNDISVSSMVMNYGSATRETEIRNREILPLYTFPVAPDIKKIDVLFFGSFANRSQSYHDYLRRYAEQIPAFVEAGGVVVEMNQWARYSFLHPGFLPEGMRFVRETWSGTDDIIITDKDHPLIKGWAVPEDSLRGYPKQWHRPGRFYEGNRSWESIAEWQGMRLLIGAGGGYRKTESQPGRAALLEAQHGKGRYLLSSLWIDKLFDREGKSMTAPATVQVGEQFFHSLHGYVSDIKAGRIQDVRESPMPPVPLIGPMLGHIDHEQAVIWLRGNKEGKYTLRLWQEGQEREGQSRFLSEQAHAAGDYCMQWRFDGLKPGMKYCYTIEDEQGKLFEQKVFRFRTAPSPGVPAKVTLAFGSCVDQNGRFSELWRRVAEGEADGMVLLGDTPYIDSTVKIQQRLKHREFLSQEGPAFLSKLIPFWGTWDDHDFGANDSDGNVHNRQQTREVFKEYRALESYGESGEGIYTSFRRGPVEVFLLDTRYFSETEPSFAVPEKPTLIGRRQWEWLKDRLKLSSAPFKILAAGMTWDSKSTGTQTDSWEAYVYEREAIIDFLGQEKITGVILVGGDIHCTQVMKYPTEERIGYPLYHIVTSPMHNRVIREHEALEHPGMLFARAEPNTFLKITADTRKEPGLLTAEIIDMTGQAIYRLVTGGELGVSVRP